MTRIAISGASGDLGRRLTAALLEKVAPETLTLITRTPENLSSRAAQGACVFRGDYRDPASLDTAYAGNEVLMLISGLDVTRRVPEHRNAINAAKRAGIKHIVYTSTAGIHPKNPTLSAGDHLLTEADLRASGLSFTILRNATYAEIIAALMAPPIVATGKWLSAAGEGRLAPVSKLDVVRCAACCLLDPAFHSGATYEISGPELLSFREIAALAAEIHGVPIEYVPVSREERLEYFDSLGYPRTYDEHQGPSWDGHRWASDEMVSADIGFSQNYHAILSYHVEFITGQKPRSLRAVFEYCKGKRYEQL